jgi:hypothetical protein
MRKELCAITKLYLTQLDFSVEPSIPQKILNALAELSLYVAQMRTVVHADWRDGYSKIIVDEPKSEYGTRLVKQFQKLAKLLAIIRGRTEVTWDEYYTVRRVAEDTCFQPRIRIIKTFTEPKARLLTADIQRKAKFRTFPLTKRNIQDLEALDILLKNEDNSLEIASDFRSILKAVYPDPQTLLTETSTQDRVSYKENYHIANASVNESSWNMSSQPKQVNQSSVSIALTRFKGYVADYLSVGELKASQDLGIPVNDLKTMAKLEPSIEYVKGTFKCTLKYEKTAENPSFHVNTKDHSNTSNEMQSPNQIRVNQSRPESSGVVPSKYNNKSYLTRILSQKQSTA